MTDQKTVKALLAETERLWLLAVQARRAAAAKQREYAAALLEWTEAEAKNKNGDDAINQSTAWKQAYELSGGNSDTTARLARRLAMLDAAEVALTDCGLTGIYDDFSSPANAIKQMVERLVQLEGGQALQAERQLRQKAEQRAERAEALAALVTPGLVELLESLARYWYQPELYNKAIALAAEIREALDEC